MTILAHAVSPMFFCDSPDAKVRADGPGGLHIARERVRMPGRCPLKHIRSTPVKLHWEKSYSKSFSRVTFYSPRYFLVFYLLLYKDVPFEAKISPDPTFMNSFSTTIEPIIESRVALES